MKTFAFTLVFWSALHVAQAQAPHPMEYFPYHAGDTIQFREQFSGNLAETTIFLRDTSDEKGYLYRMAYHSYWYHGSEFAAGYETYKIDTTNYYVYALSSNPCMSNNPIYKLTADSGETWDACGGYKRAALGARRWGNFGGAFGVSFRYFANPDPGYDLIVEHLVAGYGRVMQEGEGSQPWILSAGVIGGKRFGVLYPIAGVRVEVGRLGVQVAPNPSSSQFRVALPSGIQLVGVELYDGLGRCVARKDAFETGEISFDVSGLPVGAYWVVVWTRQGKFLNIPVVVAR